MKKKFNLKRTLLLSLMLVVVFLPAIGSMKAEAGIMEQIQGAMGNEVSGDNQLSALGETTVNFLISNGTSGANGLFTKVRDIASADNPIKHIAISLIAIYFVVEVLSKTTAIDKITMDMIIKVLLQLLVAKLLVDNAAVLLDKIHSFILNSLSTIATDLSGELTSAGAHGKLYLFGLSEITGGLLPGAGGDTVIMEVYALGPVVNIASVIASALVFLDKIAAGAGLPSIAQAAKSAVLGAAAGAIIGLLFGNVSPSGVAGITISAALTGGLSLIIFCLAMLARVLIYLLVTAFCAITIQVTLWMREIELLVLLFLSPLAMAAFVSDKFRSTTVKFISHFAAICVQGLVIVIICYVVNFVFYGSAKPGVSGAALSIIDWLGEGLNAFGMLGPVFAAVNDIFPVIILSSLIAKSRSFAQIICGA